jgi:hypothetical protein
MFVCDDSSPFIELPSAPQGSVYGSLSISIQSRVSLTKDEVRIFNWIFNRLQVVTKNNCYTGADLHNLQSLHTNLLGLS